MKITGYRQLNDEEGQLINEIKAFGQTIEGHVEEVQSYLRTMRTNAQNSGDTTEIERINLAQPERWTAIARTHFQEGLMALVRAVAQPGGF